MKYRRLSKEELESLEKDFVKFLASNHITADDWVKLKAKNSKKVENLIAIYSDIVFDKTLSNLAYLEFKTPHDIKTFHCQVEKMIMFGIVVAPNSGVDFTQNLSAQGIMLAIKESGQNIQIYTAEKKYNENREKELFNMMESGCLISKDGYLFKTLSKLKS